MLISPDRFDLHGKYLLVLNSAWGSTRTHTNADDVELETSFQQLALDLLGDAVKADVTAWEHGIRHLRSHA
jgi:hypothetical protein